MTLAFDEMKALDGSIRPAYAQLNAWLGSISPDVLDHRRREAELLFRRIGITFAVYGDADATERLIPFDVLPRILAAKEWDLVRRGLEQRVRTINAYIKDVYGRREILKRRDRARGPGVPQPGVSPGDERPERAARHLRPHRRHRHRAHRRRDVLRARGQRAHAVRRLLHAGEPRNHDAAVPGAVLAPSRRAGRELSGRTAGDLEIGRAGVELVRSDRRPAHARAVQLGLLRALVPRRQARGRAGRGPRPPGQGRGRLHAHDRRPQARRRDLPAHRRRLSRSARVPPRLARSACPA